MNKPSDAERAWADYKPSLRDLLTELIGRKGYVPPEWTAYFDEKYMRLKARNQELEKQVGAREIPFDDGMINVGVDQAESVSSRLWRERECLPLDGESWESARVENADTYPENFSSFAFGLEEYTDHYLLFDDTNFPPSRINKPANPAVINEMIAARVNERAQVVANHLTQVVFEAEVRNKLIELLSECVSLADVHDLTDAVLDKFDVRYRAKFPEWMSE
ncbi:hypothetical protein ACFYU5_18765 [Nocardia aobensis]|uniref:Uncharacterized protein n=1 Tax=Nocardia aobensis TaxID=257277 RepID=A0ABW6P5M4_9NOCA